MSSGTYAPGYGGAAARTDGVLTRRALAYLVDLLVIAGLSLLFGILVGIAGVLTLGAAWLLYAVLVPAVAILYSALTVGGRAQATVGMRVFDLAAVDASTGRPVGPLLAGIHAGLFYLGVSTFLLLLLDVAIGLARADRRLGHDLLVGILLVRR